MTAATLSYQDQFAWGLRVNPSFDQLAKSATKKFRFKQPDRRAKWWALSNERAFMLDAANRYNDYEHMRLDYDQSGAQAPSAAALAQPAPEGDDPVWYDVAETTERAEDHDYVADGFARVWERLRNDAAAEGAAILRQQAARALMPQRWFIGDNHEDLELAGVEHEPPHPLLDEEPARRHVAAVPMAIANGHAAVSHFRRAEHAWWTAQEGQPIQPGSCTNRSARRWLRCSTGQSARLARQPVLVKLFLPSVNTHHVSS
jgi:hypothetical protein